MGNIILTSYTPLDAFGGVPRWNRDFVAAFPGTKHYSWTDVRAKLPESYDTLPEWNKAECLNSWLRLTGKVKKDDIIVVDGFWGIGLESYPNVVSVAHGNWSHTTQDDVEKGIPPEFPHHHAVQLEYRKKHLARGGRIVAVSEFIAHQCKIQWGMDMHVINNAIDTTKFTPVCGPLEYRPWRPLIIHGTTTSNKGFDHIEKLKELGGTLRLLDDAAAEFKMQKYDVLKQADLVVHPSAHEGNSYFVLETLASGVPILSYNVGLMYEAKLRGEDERIGFLLDRRFRSPEYTLRYTKSLLNHLRLKTEMRRQARMYAENHDQQRFAFEWSTYLRKEFPSATIQSR